MLRKGLMGTVCCVLLSGASWGQEMPKPGPEHEKFKKLVGDWEATLKMGPQEMKGSSTFKTELNGFYLIQHFKCDFGGMPFEGKGTSSYCPIRKKYISVWTDNMSPSISIMTGKFTDDKTMVEDGESPDMSGKMGKKRAKTIWKDDDTQHFSMYDVGEDGKETLSFEIVYKRKK